jgi:hypothetical protein
MSQQRGIQVGADGLFEFSNLSAGTYTVRGRMEGYAQGRSAPVDLGDGQAVSGVEITLGSGGSLQGYVAVSGRPQAGALVTVLGDGFVREPTAADENGFYRINQLPSGSYLATAVPVAGGGISGLLSPMSARVQIVEGTTTTHNFGEPTNTALLGHCMPAPSAGTMGFAVLLAPGTSPDVIPSIGIIALMSWFQANLDKFVGGNSVDPNGDFRIDNLVAGEYPLVVVLGNMADVLTGGGGRQFGYTGVVTIVDGQVTELEIPISGG